MNNINQKFDGGTASSKKKVSYSGNKLECNIMTPKKNFFQWKNDDIENPDLNDSEYRLLQKLYSMKNNSIINVNTIADKFGKDVRTIERTLQKLTEKQYICVTEDKHLIILRLGHNDTPLLPYSTEELKKKFVSNSDEK